MSLVASQLKHSFPIPGTAHCETFAHMYGIPLYIRRQLEATTHRVVGELVAIADGRHGHEDVPVKLTLDHQSVCVCVCVRETLCSVQIKLMSGLLVAVQVLPS